ncbi:MAG: hypothetical protein K2I72_02275, partial [Bacilli bacterium]|nr:hypothetical protein [Bacilli bacterium]
MFEASQTLTQEYAKRVLLDNIDRIAFLDLVTPYRKDNMVDFEKMKQDGIMDQYNLLAYLTTASSLKKGVLESVIAEHSHNPEKKEEADKQVEKQLNRIKKLQGKTILGTQSGGFIDELELSEGGGSHQSSIVIGDSVLDTSNQPVEKQISTYKEGLEKILLEKMGKSDSQLAEQGMTTVCSTVQERAPIIKDVIEEEVKA